MNSPRAFDSGAYTGNEVLRQLEMLAQSLDEVELLAMNQGGQIYDYFLFLTASVGEAIIQEQEAADV